MSNWAKLQEDLIGLPVAKRARHGIHFQNSDGSITANFSGKQCHYFEGGLWKPIDTKLVALGDGYYGCPHSKVKIKPDGSVAVIGTDYVQRVELPSAQTGLLDGDKLIRKFAFGEQRMWVTEDGFKSEIQLNRIPTLTEAKKLIASESGTLSKEYLKSLTSAEDAKGNTHTVTTLSAFRTWLASAAFPVVIDPDIAITTGVGADNRIDSSAPTYNYGATTLISLDTDRKSKELIRFDLSSIDAGNTCTAGTMKLVADVGEEEDTYNLYKVTDANGDWVEGGGNNALAAAGESCWNAKAANGSGGVTTAWAGSAGLATAGTDYVNTIIATATAAVADEATLEVVFNAAGLVVLQDWFGDATNNGFLMVNASTTIRTFRSKEDGTAGKRPVLTVTYTAGGGAYAPTINMVGNMQNLNGLRG